MPLPLLTFRSLLRFQPVLLLMMLVLVLLAGCTSDQPDRIGMGLVDTQFEVELEPMEISNTTMYSSMVVNDEGVPLDQQEALYMGSQGGNSSSVLANFNFDDIYTDVFVDTMFTSEHIVSVNMRIMVLDYYQSLGFEDEGKSGDKGLIKDFLLYQLDAPFDSTAFPGPEPAHLDEILNEGGDPDFGTTFKIKLPVYEAHFLDWVEQGGLVGFMLTEGNSTEPGLVGYASRDMTHGGSTLDDVHEDVPLGMSFQITFDDDSIQVIESVADISTFHEISEIPEDSADGFVLRTVLRSYPLLKFELSSLPPNIFINQAMLQVANDTSLSFGNIAGMMAAEVDTAFFGAQYDTLALRDLEDITTSFRGMGVSSFDPVNYTFAQFNVTTSIQRYINEAYDGERGFILTGSELYTAPYYDSYSISAPDIFFVEYHFHGTNDPDPDLRPKLKIVYTTVDEFQKGGVR